jgi:hypothetical protein
MNKPAGNVKRKAQKPQNYKDYKDCPKHMRHTPLSVASA